MTRINLLPPEKLTDQHLLAEYRELPRVFPLARAALDRPKKKAPAQYTMGEGHVTFFYRRTAWLAERHAALVSELQARGYQPKLVEPLTPAPSALKSWSPSPEEVAINRARLIERLHGAPRPGFYTYHGRPVDADFYGV
jgi:deoxyribonuclease (pyrimidine dimer)